LADVIDQLSLRHQSGMRIEIYQMTYESVGQLFDASHPRDICRSHQDGGNRAIIAFHNQHISSNRSSCANEIPRYTAHNDGIE
jgi:hypothetical protein